ncbi:hypothetical protein PV328_008405 [Microctonus aethiopoides]|uniref:Uncharacterized protein n=1 Tax=Microctonus aethiopoides TaxID=144406 RepID=A0AA39FJ96_9HYME|nr:hypothetical protein PV328_008405 [Microctonus aethiopoides]
MVKDALKMTQLKSRYGMITRPECICGKNVSDKSFSVLPGLSQGYFGFDLGNDLHSCIERNFAIIEKNGSDKIHVFLTTESDSKIKNYGFLLKKQFQPQYNYEEGNIRNFCLRRKRLMKITEQLQERNYRVGICKNFDEVPDTIIDAIENCGLK